MEGPHARTYQHLLRARSTLDWRMAPSRWSFRKGPHSNKDHCPGHACVCRGCKLRVPSKELDKVEARIAEIQGRIPRQAFWKLTNSLCESSTFAGGLQRSRKVLRAIRRVHS